MKTYGPREKRQARRNGSLARRVRMGGTVVRSAIFSVATAVLFGGPPAWAAEPVGVVTILEGDALAIRGLSKLVLAEGVRIAGDYLFEAGTTTFLRTQFPHGALVPLG